jgi:hypothetical protein
MAMEKLPIQRPMRVKSLSAPVPAPSREISPYGELYKRGPYLAPISKPTGSKAK